MAAATTQPDRNPLAPASSVAVLRQSVRHTPPHKKQLINCNFTNILETNGETLPTSMHAKQIHKVGGDLLELLHAQQVPALKQCKMLISHPS